MYLQNNDKITRKEVEVLLNTSKSRTDELLKRLVEDGILVVKGKNKSTYYVLNNNSKY